MILVDSSVWVDHFRRHDEQLGRLLAQAQVLIHPWIIGELALGHLSSRATKLGLLSNLPGAPVADPAEVLLFIERHGLAGRGVGYVDVQLLAAARLAGVGLLTRDKRLATVAAEVLH